MRRIADVNCLFVHDASLAAFADSYCNEIEIVHPSGVPGADAHSISTVVSCARDTGGWDFSGDVGLRDAVMDHLLRSICKASAGLMPALAFLRRTEGGRGICMEQTCAGAQSAHKAAHIGTTRPTSRSEWLRRCAFLTCAVVQPSTLRSQAALGSGFSLQAAFWYQNAMLALFLRSKKSLKCSPILIPLRRIFCFSFCTSHEIQNFCALDAVVATLVAMRI